MSTTGFNFAKTGANVRIADFIAFVSDRATEQVLKSFVLEQAMPHVHIVLGGIDDAIAYVGKLERSPLFLLIDLQAPPCHCPILAGCQKCANHRSRWSHWAYATTLACSGAC